MKGFFNWFRANTRMKRWLLVILLGILLSSNGIVRILITNELDIQDIAIIAGTFVVGFLFIVIRNSIYTKKNIGIVNRSK